MKREDVPPSQTEYALTLLVLWHRAEDKWLPVEGYPRECPSTSLGWRSSTQYDYDHPEPVYWVGQEEGREAPADGTEECTADVDFRGAMIRQVGQIVKGMEEPYRTALCLLARNRSMGYSVWKSPRLPKSQTEVMEIVAEALARFERLV